MALFGTRLGILSGNEDLWTITKPGTAGTITTMDPMALCPLSSTKGVVYGSDGSGLDAQVVTIDSDYDVTIGTKYAVEASTSYEQYVSTPYGIALSSTKGILAYNQSGGNKAYKVACFTESGGVLTIGTPVTVSATGGSEGIGLAMVDSSKAIVSYEKSGSFDTYIRVLSISGTTITAGTELNTGVDRAGDVCVLTSSRGVVIGGGDKGARAFSISGTTVALEGSELTFTSDTVLAKPRIQQIDSTHALVGWTVDNGTSATTIETRIIEDNGSGTLSTIGSQTESLSIDAIAGQPTILEKLSNTRYLIGARQGSSGAGYEMTFRVLAVNGSTIDASSGNQYTTSTNSSSIYLAGAGLGKKAALFTHTLSGTDYVEALKIS